MGDLLEVGNRVELALFRSGDVEKLPRDVQDNIFDCYAKATEGVKGEKGTEVKDGTV